MSITKAQRARIPARDFAGGGPHGSKGFPLNTKKRARAAISGATRSEHAGNISAAEARRIKAEARAKLRDKAHADYMRTGRQ